MVMKVSGGSVFLSAASSMALVVMLSGVVFASVARGQAAAGAMPANALKPGEYISEGGAGSLTLKSGKNGALRFAIEVVGANGHTCSLDGELTNGRAKLEALDEKDPCVVTMTPAPSGIEVKGSASGSCQYYCGVRATFEATYFQPAPACRDKAVATTRKLFKQLYDAKKFAEARAKLEPLLNDCTRSLHWLDSGRIRNDLAVTLHKLGDLAGCQAVLRSLAGDAKATDAELQERYPPTDLESYLPIVRSTRTNLKLCLGK